MATLETQLPDSLQEGTNTVIVFRLTSYVSPTGVYHEHFSTASLRRPDSGP